MSSGSYIQVDVLCPFYRSDTSRPVKIICEGIANAIFCHYLFKIKMKN